MSSDSTRHEIGVQSFTYREFDVPGLCDELAETPVTEIELCHEHVTPSMDPSAIDEVRSLLHDVDLDVCGYGVVAFDGDSDDVEETFDLVERLDGDYLSLEFPPDEDDVVEELLRGASERDVQLAIHNHGPDSTYSEVGDVLAVLEDHPDDRLGACVDIGHYYRSLQSPDDVVPALGDSVLAVHFSDVAVDDNGTMAEGGEEAIPGEGLLDVQEFHSLLEEHTSFDNPLVIEYEGDPDDPTPAVVQAAQAVVRTEEPESS